MSVNTLDQAMIHIQSIKEMNPADSMEMFFERKAAFVEKAGWDVPLARAAIEVDQYDTTDARYCLAKCTARNRFSVRILSRDQSMVAELWPEFLKHTPAGSMELSRFVAHGKPDPRWNRKAIPSFRKALAEHGGQEWFGIADARMIRVYGAIMNYPPDHTTEHPSHRGLFLVRWQINEHQKATQ